MFLKRDSIKIGIIVGLVLPFLGFWLWKGIFELLTLVNVMDPSGFSEDWRERTFALLAICMNIIPFQYYQKIRNDDTMRGLVFPTFLYVVLWVVIFRDSIFGQ
jgi:hypothetical protein